MLFPLRNHFATAQALAECGARVALFARSKAELESAARKIGGAALAVPADVTDPESVRRGFAAVDTRFGRLDILVNNAAIGRLHRIEDASDEDLRAEVSTNVLGVMYCAREAIGPMRSAGGGDIVNISSEAIHNPFPYLSVYVATKGAVEAFSLALRAELRSEGIRVTLLRSGASSGGFVREWDPEMARRAFEVWQEQGYLKFVGTPMPPELIAESVVHAVTRAPGANIDVLEIRSAR